jgi:hypothetical protein
MNAFGLRDVADFIVVSHFVHMHRPRQISAFMSMTARSS